MMFEYSMMDDFFKEELFPLFNNNVEDVCRYISKEDLRFKGDKNYSLMCNTLYNMFKACLVSKMSCVQTLNCVTEETSGKENILVGDVERFVQALLCYYILCNNEGSLPELEKAREVVLLELTKEGEEMGTKRSDIEEAVGELKATSWDEYYFNIARQVAANSKCLSRKIGCVIVKDKSIVGTGYNSPPRGVPSCDQRWNKDGMLHTTNALADLAGKCPRQVLEFKSGQGMEYCTASHAEESTITNCARMGVQTKGAIMYMTCGIPCFNCMVTIINAGISELVVTNLDFYDKLSQYLLENSDVKVRKFDFLGD